MASASCRGRPNAAGGPPTARIRPYPLFNVALNLVGGKNLAWQQRKAASFIFSPEYCGFEYRVDEDNEQERKQVRQDGNAVVPRAAAFRSAYAPTGDHANDPTSLTVGLAVATSGAAASPNMGYHTSPTLAFLMTVFNVRLGWWLRNPRWAKVWTDKRSRLSLVELLSELLGMTTDDRSWVYLSDGGHFENLGIYELVRRRCRFIIASDAGQDGHVTFEDLGNAIEKCRADFGVDIEIDLTNIRLGAGRFSEWHCAIGSIRYDSQNPDEAQGTLLYIKSSLTGDEPADVLRYASLPSGVSAPEHLRSVLRRIAIRELSRARLSHRLQRPVGCRRARRDGDEDGGRALYRPSPAMDAVGAGASGCDQEVLESAVGHLDDGADDAGARLSRRAALSRVGQLPHDRRGPAPGRRGVAGAARASDAAPMSITGCPSLRRNGAPDSMSAARCCS